MLKKFCVLSLFFLAPGFAYASEDIEMDLREQFPQAQPLAGLFSKTDCVWFDSGKKYDLTASITNFGLYRKFTISFKDGRTGEMISKKADHFEEDYTHWTGSQTHHYIYDFRVLKGSIIARVMDREKPAGYIYCPEH